MSNKEDLKSRSGHNDNTENNGHGLDITVVVLDDVPVTDDISSTVGLFQVHLLHSFINCVQ